ncbi:uncharacterized protein LY79DRAFT_534591 [Colletotrichum navitas]|uniref:Uncharacterized protein n=1 Tax=Colletotrichum navitas TaxID=681940 RepID=A0AAD8QDQ7_9PEZI|nr:uncharacterized protein LY79DRAFT_534591 [Colletotrichum navitas]KAK1600757.1 hypothetical protein LY79DRAFT_534591 [Colletotrichum navitas]
MRGPIGQDPFGGCLVTGIIPVVSSLFCPCRYIAGYVTRCVRTSYTICSMPTPSKR